MSNNSGETSPRFRLVMRVIGIAVALIPALIVLIAPPPYGYRVDYNSTKGLGFVYFILSIPIGIFINSFGKNPTRTKKTLFIVLGVWLGFSALALIGDLIARLFNGTL